MSDSIVISPDESLENLDLTESILQVLIHESQQNDLKRLFAGLRKPSRTTRQLYNNLSAVYNHRKAIYKQ